MSTTSRSEAQAWAEPDAEYVPSPAIEEVARGLINRHPRFRPLDELRIVYCERIGEVSGEGESAIAKCQKATGPWRDVAHVDVVIWVWRDVWTTLRPTQREALVAHELCHPFIDDQGRLKILKHDIEEFIWVARQYGPWLGDVAAFGDALRAHSDEHKVTPIRPRKVTP